MSSPTIAADPMETAPTGGAYVPATSSPPELTLSALVLGAILGIIFGASSLYLVLRVGMTVSASIPVAVLSITLFRAAAKILGRRPATILENNIVQTTGSAGESIAFGVGVTMPALMILGYDMTAVQVMLVAALGGLLGILMMIPLRRAFVVNQHETLAYPEGTACAKVLIVGEQGGSSARTVFTGFGLAFVYQILMQGLKLWEEIPARRFARLQGGGPELRGVADLAGRRVHHRPADRVGDGRGGHPGVSRPDADDQPVRVGRRRGDLPGDQADRRHVGQGHSRRLHPLHRRGGGGGGRDHLAPAGPADDPRVAQVGPGRPGAGEGG